MTKALLQGETVLSYIDKFPTLSKQALAEKIMHDHPLLFNSRDSARASVRYHTGASGKKSRSNNPTAKKFNALRIPKSEAIKPKVHFLRTPAKILWISDIHIPNHDETALGLAIQFGMASNADTIVIGGDLMDNAPFSSWEKPPSVNQVRKWFDMTYEFLYGLRMNFPKADIVWIEGNHCKWYEKWLIKKAPILFDDPHYKMQTRLRLDELGIEYIPENIKVRAGHLFMLHGHTLIKGVFSPVNGARGVFLRAKSSVIIGHVHSSSKHSESNLKGQLIGCWSTGCLCTLSPDYDPHNTKHNQGFAFIEVEKGGDFRVDNYEIHNGKIY